MFMTMRWWSYVIWKILYPRVVPILIKLISALPENHSFRIWRDARLSKEPFAPNLEHQQQQLLVLCPSLGEYESSKHVTSALRREAPDLSVEVCFFSPSGYNHLRDRVDHDVRHVSYSPVDTNHAVDLFFKIRQVDIVLISSLSIWPVFLDALIKLNIPYHFIAVQVRPGFLKHLYYLSCKYYLERAATINTIDKLDSARLFSITSTASIVTCGDPRLGSIRDDLNHPNDIGDIAHYKGQSRLIIFASTHPADHKVIVPAINSSLNLGYKVIIAPHEIEHCSDVIEMLSTSAQLYSNWSKDEQNNILIIDRLGILKYLYRLCDIAYVGGGFSKGVHNIAEPLISGCPVIIGPNYKKSYLASNLIKAQITVPISNTSELIRSIETYVDTTYHKSVILKSKAILDEYEGATKRIIKAIKHSTKDSNKGRHL